VRCALLAIRHTPFTVYNLQQPTSAQIMSQRQQLERIMEIDRQVRAGLYPNAIGWPATSASAGA